MLPKKLFHPIVLLCMYLHLQVSVAQKWKIRNAFKIFSNIGYDQLDQTYCCFLSLQGHLKHRTSSFFLSYDCIAEHQKFQHLAHLLEITAYGSAVLTAELSCDWLEIRMYCHMIARKKENRCPQLQKTAIKPFWPGRWSECWDNF